MKGKGKETKKEKTKKMYSVAKRAINRYLETHHHNEYNTGIEVNTTGNFQCLSDITQGDGDNERLGDTLMLKSITGNMNFIAGSAGTVSAVRCVIFQWKPDNNVDAPAVNKILFDATNVPYLSNFVIDQSKFRVLKDWLFHVGPVSGASNNLVLKRVNIYKDFKEKIEYQGAGTTGSNQIYIMVIGNNTTGTTAPNYYYHLRLKYKA